MAPYLDAKTDAIRQVLAWPEGIGNQIPDKAGELVDLPGGTGCRPKGAVCGGRERLRVGVDDNADQPVRKHLDTDCELEIRLFRIRARQPGVYEAIMATWSDVPCIAPPV